MFFVMGTERLLPAKLGFITEMLPKSKVKMHFQLPAFLLYCLFLLLEKDKNSLGYVSAI